MDNNRDSTLLVSIKPMNENIIKVVYTRSKEVPGNSILIAEDFVPQSNLISDRYLSADDCILFKNEFIKEKKKQYTYSNSYSNAKIIAYNGKSTDVMKKK